MRLLCLNRGFNRLKCACTGLWGSVTIDGSKASTEARWPLPWIHSQSAQELHTVHLVQFSQVGANAHGVNLLTAIHSARQDTCMGLLPAVQYTEHFKQHLCSSLVQGHRDGVNPVLGTLLGALATWPIMTLTLRVAPVDSPSLCRGLDHLAAFRKLQHLTLHGLGAPEPLTLSVTPWHLSRCPGKRCMQLLSASLPVCL